MSAQKTEPTPFEKFAALTKRVIATPKKEINKRETEYRNGRLKKKKASGHC
jgi:hypothetical protein